MAINSSSFANVCLPLTVGSRVCNECSEIYAGTAVPVASLKWTGEAWQWKWHGIHGIQANGFSCPVIQDTFLDLKHLKSMCRHSTLMHAIAMELITLSTFSCHTIFLLFYFILLHNIMHELCHVWLVSNHLNCFRLIKHEVLNQPVSHRITPACCSLQ